MRRVQAVLAIFVLLFLPFTTASPVSAYDGFPGGYIYYSKSYDGIPTQIRDTGYGYENIDSNAGKNPALSHRDHLLAFVSTADNAISIEEFGGQSVGSAPLGSIQADYLAWSPNDYFLAVASKSGQLYILDLYGLSAGGSNWVGPLTINTGSLMLTGLDWDTLTNKIYYSVNGLGLWSIYPDGTRLGQIINTPTDIHNFSLSADGTKVATLTQNGKLDIIDLSSKTVTNVVSNDGATRGSVVWPDTKQNYIAYTELSNGIASIQYIDVTTKVSITIASQYDTVQSYDNLAFMSQSGGGPRVLYRPIITMDPYRGAPTQTFSISLHINSKELLGKTISVTPYTIHNSMPGIFKQPISYSVTTMEQEITIPVTVDLVLGGNGLGCSVSYEPDIYLTQDCGFNDGMGYAGPSYDLVPVYRFWSPKNQHHFYTSSAQEMEIVRATYPSYIWTYEGVAFEAADDPGCQNSTPIYRFWSAKNQSHFYTASAQERDIIRSSYPEDVWKYEGVAYCAASADDPSASPVYRFWSAKLQGHFYTNSAEERDIIRSSYPENVWKYEGVAYYAY